MLEINFTPFPTLETGRLILRQLSLDDAEEILFLRSNPDVNRFIDRPRATSKDDAINFINMINRLVASNEGMYWAITYKDHPALIGTICFWNFEKENFVAEIGYELNPAFQGKGIMKEAMVAAIEFGFEQLNLQRIIACPFKENDRSIRLLDKFKFLHEDPPRESEPGILVYYLDRENYQQQL